MIEQSQLPNSPFNPDWKPNPQSPFSPDYKPPETIALEKIQMNKRVKIVYKDDDSQKVKNRRSSTNKIKTLLGFSPNIKVKDGLRKYVSVMDD